MHIPDRIIRRLGGAERVVFLTGAGISAESGIATFREAGGHWSGLDPMELASPEGFRRNPAVVQRWYAERIIAINAASPNPGHLAVAALQNVLPDVTVVTQNVDQLHQRGGATEVLELHGNIHRQFCITCGTPSSHSLADVDVASLPLRCSACDGLIRPGVVWFGESLPTDTFANAEQAAVSADVFFTVGTSAVVHPAASLIATTRDAGAFVVEVNVEPTDAAFLADDVLVGRSGAVLPSLLDRMTGLLAAGSQTKAIA